MVNKTREIMIVAGEASGDRLGAELVRELRKRRGVYSIFGTPGPAMRLEGVESILDSDTWSVVGIGAVIGAIPGFLKHFSKLRRIANERMPDVVILIDFPEFNLKLAQRLKKDGHRVIYYVSPQVWAWRKYRVRTVGKYVDLLLSILPFEKEWYSKQGIEHVQFVGNPVVSRVNLASSKDEFCNHYSLDPERPTIALLPGSRLKEINRHLPIMKEAAERLTKHFPSLQFAIAAANSAARHAIEGLLAQDRRIEARVVEGDTISLLRFADAAAISSGTATLEAGVAGTPMVVVYRLPALDYRLFRPFIHTPHVALVNLVAGKRIVKELIQNDLTAANLAAELKRLLDRNVNNALRAELRSAVESLVDGSSSEKAADAILEFLKSGSANDLEARDRSLKQSI